MTTPQEQMMEFNQKLILKGFEMGLRVQKAISNSVENRFLRVGETPSEVIYQDNKLKLLHYHAVGENVSETPLLIIYALINKPYILDLQPDKSVVQALLKRGIDVYMIDWGTPVDTDRYIGFEDYIEIYINDCVNIIRKRTGQDKISVLGYCIGGTLAVMYAALHPDRINNLMIMAAPVDFDNRKGLLHVWTDRSYFDADKIVDTLGNLPPEGLNTAFLMLDPADNLFNKYVTYGSNLDNPEFVRRFLRMEHWIFDSIPLTGEFYRKYIKDLYQRNLLVMGEFFVGDRRVELGRIDMPVLIITAERDTQVPPEACIKLSEHVSSKDKRTILFPSGHIGLTVGSKAHSELWPDVAVWLKERSGKEIHSNY